MGVKGKRGFKFEVHTLGRRFFGVMPLRPLLLIALILASVLKASCGGNHSAFSGNVSANLRVALVAGGTFVDCISNQPLDLLLIRTVENSISSENISCPVSRVISGDLRLSEWELTTRGNAIDIPFTITKTNTALPQPANSTVIRPLIPRTFGHPVHGNPATDSTVILPLLSGSDAR